MHLKYRADIDGLRAFAVLSVIIYHLNSSWLHGGFIGVDIFFVISGFLITKIIYSEIEKGEFSFKTFYQRRINRILPVFFVVMFCTSFVAWYLLLPDEFMLFLRSLKTTTYFWENMFFAQNTGGYWDAAAETMPLLHTWSLAVEEQFYIILPFVLLFLFGIKFKIKEKYYGFNKLSILIILALLAITSFCLAQFSPKSLFLSKYNYYSLFTGRAGELLIGSIIAILSLKSAIVGGGNSSNCENCQKILLKQKNFLSIFGFLCVIFSFIFISQKILFPSFWALIPTLGAALVLYNYDEKTYLAKFLSFKPTVFIGKISYSLYLWHWPVFVLARKYLFVENFVSFKQYFIAILTTFILALLTYYLVESPCRKYKRSFKFSFIVYYLIPSLLILGTYYSHKKTKFLNFRYEKRMELYRLQKRAETPEIQICHNKIIGDCIFGDKTKKPTILMIGDSHGGHYTPYIDEVGKNYGFAVKSLSSSECNYSLNFNPFLDLSPVREKCQKFVNEVRKNIKEFKVIILAYRLELFYNDTDYLYNKSNDKNRKQLFINNLTKYLITLKKMQKEVIIFAQTPTLNMNEINRYYDFYLKNKKFQSNIILDKREIQYNEFIKKLSKDNDIIFYNPLDDLNNKHKQTWPIYNNLIAYRDFSHLGEFVTRQWAKEVLPKQKDFWEGILKIIDNNESE